MQKAKVVFLCYADKLTEETFWDHVPPEFQVIWMNAGESSEDEIVNQVRDADFLLLMRTGVPERALRQAKRLKLIQLCGQGYDRIPLHLTSELGIPVANAGGANIISVAEHTVTLMLAVLRRLCPSIAIFREGKFCTDIDRRLYHELNDKLVGIVGMGNIGRRVAKIVRGFDADVIFYDSAEIPRTAVEELKARPVGLEELLRSADIVSLHVPLMESTKHLINRERLNMMKPSAILVNAARGEIVDEKALIQALIEKTIAGAGVDVYAKEPPDPNNPLLSMENVVATPHIAGYSLENIATRYHELWGSMINILQGKPPRNVVGRPS